MAEVRARVRAEVQARLARGGVREFEDQAIFLAAEQLLERALQHRDRQQLLLPELLDDEDDWRVNPSLSLSSHRPIAGGAIIWLKRALLLPLTRWLYDYSRENFARQERLNFVLMACLQQLAIENARLVARVATLEAADRPPIRRPADPDPHEARLRGAAVRCRGHRRSRGALPRDRRAVGRVARRHRPDQLREGLPDLAQRLPAGREPAG